jgi:signal transduction histidine kinase
VEVVEPIDSALSVLDAEIREHAGNVFVSVPENIPQVKVNATALANCVRNLADNALKYGKRAAARGQVRIEAAEVSGQREVQIRVIDNGPGISPADLPHLFEPFFRGSAVAPGLRGAGLGLYLVKRQMEGQGGRVTLETSEGGGCTFILHIPSIEPRFGHDQPHAASG